MYWKEILQVYEDMGVEDIIPIAHTRVKPNIKVLLDESGNFVGAILNEQDRFTIPCTIESESRTSGCAPHPIHDNMQYLCDTYNDPKCKEKHENYMKQLEEYIEQVDDELAKSVYRFLEKGLLRDCIKDLLKKVNLPEEKVMTSQSTNDVSEQSNLQFLWLSESAGEKSAHSYLWECPKCHAVHDRDTNAGINILKKALQMQSA